MFGVIADLEIEGDNMNEITIVAQPDMKQIVQQPKDCSINKANATTKVQAEMCTQVESREDKHGTTL